MSANTEYNRFKESFLFHIGITAVSILPWVPQIQNYFNSTTTASKVGWTIFLFVAGRYLIMPLALVKRIVDLKEEKEKEMATLKEALALSKKGIVEDFE